MLELPCRRRRRRMKLATLARFDQVCEAPARPGKPIPVCVTGAPRASRHLVRWFQAKLCR
jgi:hypothetical protein